MPFKHFDENGELDRDRFEEDKADLIRHDQQDKDEKSKLIISQDPTPPQDDASATVEGKLTKLEQFCKNIGICTTCGEPYVHEINEPFAYCNCGTSEWAFQDINKEPYLIRKQFEFATASAAKDARIAEQDERIDWLEQQREFEHQRAENALNESGKCLKEVEESRSRIEALSRELDELQARLSGKCSRCGGSHDDHTGCSSDWTGTDKQGR